MDGIKINESVFLGGVGSLHHVVTTACGLINKHEKQGGFFCLADHRGNLIIVMPVGVIPNEKAPEYSKYCIEKASRLGFFSDQCTSWQSRNVEEEKYGGAIRSGQYVLSFSGFPEHWDEACMCIFGLYRCGLLEVDLQRIKKISDNPFIDPLLTAVEFHGKSSQG